MYVSQRRGVASARTFFTAALAVHGDPAEVITDRAPALANAIEGLIAAALHNTGQYENNRVECDHGRLKAMLRPMRGLRTERTASVVIRVATPSFRTSAAATTRSPSTPGRVAVAVGHRIQRTQSRHLTSPGVPSPASAWPGIDQRNRADRAAAKFEEALEELLDRLALIRNERLASSWRPVTQSRLGWRSWRVERSSGWGGWSNAGLDSGDDDTSE